MRMARGNMTNQINLGEREMKQGVMTVTKRFNFCYAHWLPGYNGPCVNLHGHNSEVEVEFAQNMEMPLAYADMVADFRDIKRIVGPIIAKLDHQELNQFFAVPTAEAITNWIVQKIQQTPLGIGLVRVRVSETPDSHAEWRCIICP